MDALPVPLIEAIRALVADGDISAAAESGQPAP
jgi:hypothetical protein